MTYRNLTTKAYGIPPKTNACFACHNDKSLEQWGMIIWKQKEQREDQ